MINVSMLKGAFSVLRLSRVEAEAVSRIKPSQCGYSRLKGIFTSGQNYRNYDRIVSTAKRKVVGNIPRELLDAIIKAHPEQKAEIIKGVQAAFSQTAETLKLASFAKIDAVRTLRGVKAEKDFIVHMLYEGRLPLKISDGEIQMAKAAARELKQALRGIIPEGSRVEIKFVGEGAFGDGYQLSIVDKNGNKVIHDRLIKVFKDEQMLKELKENEIIKFNEIINKYSDKEILKYIKKNYKSLFERMLDDKMLIKRIQGRRNCLTAYNPAQFAGKETSYIECLKTVHGAAAETNTITRLKHILGHNMSGTNAVDTELCDLETGYYIAQFADTELPRITSELNFKTLGLRASDLHRGNIVNGRIVDFGDMEVIDERLLDKTTLKYYKKIMNNSSEREQLIQRYKELVANPKTPLRDKIKDAIDIVENGTMKEQASNKPIREKLIFPKPNINFPVLDHRLGEIRKALKDRMQINASQKLKGIARAKGCKVPEFVPQEPKELNFQGLQMQMIEAKGPKLAISPMPFRRKKLDWGALGDRIAKFNALNRPKEPKFFEVAQ